MKRYLFIVSLICFTLLSCASTDKTEQKAKEVNPFELSSPAFEDWRYKFFGQELPVWFLYAYEDDVEGVVSSREDSAGLSSENLEIIQGKAVNGDQAEQFIAQQIEIYQNNVVDSFWAKLSEEDESGEAYRWLVLIKNN